MAELVITADEAIAWLAAYKRAWETRDSDLIVSLFSADGLYQESRFVEPFAGHDGIRTYWDTDVVARQRGIDFSFTLWGVDADVAYAHWKTTFTDMKHDATVRRLDGVFRLTFSDRGPSGLLCRRLDEWWDITSTDSVG